MKKIDDKAKYVIDVKTNKQISITEGELRKRYKDWDKLSVDEKHNEVLAYALEEVQKIDINQYIYFDINSSPLPLKKEWTEIMDKELDHYATIGMTKTEISKKMGRSIASINQRMSFLMKK